MNKHWKIIVICVLALTVVIESVCLIFKGEKKEGTQEEKAVQQVNLALNTAGLLDGLPDAVLQTIRSLTGKEISLSDLSQTVRSILYSDTVVDLLMSITYPLLHDTLINLDLMDFGEEAKLYATGEVLARYLSDKPYTCLDTDGTRKALSEVLTASGDDWSYFNTEVSYTAPDGTAKKTTLWSSIEWGVSDEASFYAAMNDMSCGLRGVLEPCIQSKSVTVNVNAVKALLDAEKPNIRLNAAVIDNNGEKTGYENALVPLFVMLGLDETEYPSADEVIGYTELSDLWRALFESILKAVDKILTSPLDKACELLVNFAAVLENGTLCGGLRKMKMDGDFHPLATLAMGYKDRELFNLGDALIDILGSLGAELSGGLNGLLDALARKISGNESIDLPDIDMNALFSLGTVTRKNGVPYYTVNAPAVRDFLIDYATGDSVAAFIKQIL